MIFFLKYADIWKSVEGHTTSLFILLIEERSALMDGKTFSWQTLKNIDNYLVYQYDILEYRDFTASAIPTQ